MRGRRILGIANGAAMVVVVFVQEEGADDVEGEADGADNEDELGILDVLDEDEALDGLQGDAEAEGEQECAVEECTEERGARPAKGHVLGIGFALGDLDGDEGDYEADEIV
jgi:hypothetical protein